MGRQRRRELACHPLRGSALSLFESVVNREWTGSVVARITLMLSELLFLEIEHTEE
jgi:hypothetical protein